MVWGFSMRKSSGDGRLQFIEPPYQPWSTSLRKADAWIHEVQFDGFRTQAIKDEDGIRFYTRRGHARLARRGRQRDPA